MTTPDDGNDAFAIEQLTARMLKKELFVVTNEAVVAPELLAGNLAAHLRYMIALEKSGVLFASGPLFNPDGHGTGAGLTIIRAKSFEEAHHIASSDPFALAGQRRFEIQRWLVSEGRIRVTVDVSDATATID